MACAKAMRWEFGMLENLQERPARWKQQRADMVREQAGRQGRVSHAVRQNKHSRGD